MTKEQFLKKLENVLQRLISERLFSDVTEVQKAGLKSDVCEFVRENAATYSLEELKETFVSAQATIGLFLEFQSAKEICDGDGRGSAGLEKQIGDLVNFGACGFKAPVLPSDNWREPLTGMEFIRVSGGSFQMGSGPWDDQGRTDEKPVHEVWLDGLWAGKYPVTVSQYLVFVTEAAKYEPAWLEGGGRYNIHTGEDDLFRALGESITSDSYPIVGICWTDAVAYARWISEKTGFYFRLPTEAEWEYAARSGGREEKYAGGADVDAVAWHSDNSDG
ncbi:MAG TPA: formylglycine-generating enzyme family protein, partial [Desulfobacteria bacterium]|nr:formylglycine-generating enzyme family protein [Desulfobacteria bacterium]